MAEQLQASPTVVSRRVGGQLILLDAGSGRYFALDDTAADVWALFRTPTEIATVIDTLSARHGAARARIDRDARAWISEAVGLALLVPHDGQRAETRQEVPVQIGPHGLTVDGSIDAMRDLFRQQHFLKLPDLLEPRLLAMVEQLVSAGDFVDRAHDGIGTELCLVPGIATGVLQLLFNDQALRRLVATVAEVPDTGCFDGRVYRMSPRDGHYDSWHSDAGEDRLVAVSVNLSPAGYEGGELEIRRASAAAAEWTVANHSFGSAVMFRISPAMRHRVVAVTGDRARTAYAGWYRGVPVFEDLFLPTLRGA